MNGCIKECPHGMVMQCLDCEEARFRSEAASAMHRPPEEGAPRATASAVAAAKAQIVEQIRWQADQYRDAYDRDPEHPVARSFAILHDIANDIETGELTARWAAEREGSR